MAQGIWNGEEEGICRIISFKRGTYVQWSHIFQNMCWEIPIGMKIKSIVYDPPYWENLKISHLLYHMCIFQKVSYYLWRHTSLKIVTHLVLVEILFFWILKINSGQEKKVENKISPLIILNKVMSCVFWRKIIFLW